MNELTELTQAFASAVKSEKADEIQKVLVSFDKTCRLLIEQETSQTNKKQLIETCLTLQKSWELEINQLKAKVKDEMADIRLNGKKIQKYLTSY
jgi:hypothetical protein